MLYKLIYLRRKENENVSSLFVQIVNCFQSTGPQKDDVIHVRGRKFNENTEYETIMKTTDNKTQTQVANEMTSRLEARKGPSKRIKHQ